MTSMKGIGWTCSGMRIQGLHPSLTLSIASLQEKKEFRKYSLSTLSTSVPAPFRGKWPMEG